MQEIIKAKKLMKSYGEQLVMDSFTVTVRRGTAFGLLGANGAGKSTAIECMLGTKKADSGEVSILGMNPISDRKKLFEKVGIQFQEMNYQDNITVAELCETVASLYKAAAEPLDLLYQFDIMDKQNSPVKELSGGQRQRLFIVLALIPVPEVIFLDELSTGLDAAARRKVWKILSSLKEKGLTIFLTSHFMEEVEALCDDICILKKGKTVFHGTVSEAIQSSPYEKFEEAYLWYTEEERIDESI